MESRAVSSLRGGFMEIFDKIRNMLFSFLTSTFGQRATRFLGAEAGQAASEAISKKE